MKFLLEGSREVSVPSPEPLRCEKIVADGRCSVLRRPDCGALWGFAFENRFFSFLFFSSPFDGFD